MNKLLLFLGLIVFFSCGTAQKFSEWNNLLKGKWRLAVDDQVDYPFIRFDSGGLAVFNSLADTIYGFRYELKNNNLTLYNSRFNKTNKIILLNKDSLVFKSLLELDSLQTYIRLK